MIKNKNCTKYFSTLQENNVAKLLGGSVQIASGGGPWEKGDVVVKDAMMIKVVWTLTSI